MTELKRDSRVFKIAYGSGKTAPSQVSRYWLFWRTVFMFLIGWPSRWILDKVVMLVVAVVAFLLCAYRWHIKSDGDADIIVPIKHWPTVRGHRVWPSCLILAGVVLYYTPLVFTFIPFIFGEVSQYLGLLGIAAVGIVALVGIYYFVR
ncbi:MAG: hypothetical protein U1C12_02025 [Patescibacteria group bacterium]|nr:hypothetical protein [Patescibacteria group bacterium]